MEKAAFDFNVFYTVVNLLLLAVSIVVGQGIQRKKGGYVANSLIFVLFYSIILGLRYNRGNDYIHYVEVFKFDLEDKQVVFTWFNDVLETFGVGPYYCFIFYAAVISICFFIFLSDYKQYAKWMVPLFLICFIWFEEFMIRQAFSWSFVFIYLKLLHVLDEYIKCGKGLFERLKVYAGLAIVAYIIYGCHSANVIVVFFVTLFYIIKKPIPASIAIPLFVFATYVFSVFFKGDMFTPYLQLLEGYDSKIDSYASQGDRWLDTSNNVTEGTRGGILKLLETWGTVALMYYGYRLLQFNNSRLYIAMYNAFLVGTIFRHAFPYLEILNRLGFVLEIFWFVPLTLFLAEYKKLRIKYGLFALGLIWFLEEYVKYVAFRSYERTLFLWDM